MPKKTRPERRSMAEHCCGMMRANIENTCDIHADRFDCGDCLIHKYEDGEYGIIIHDGGGSAVIICFCPWCGAGLPNDQPDA
jgi:hypothetical protein